MSWDTECSRDFVIILRDWVSILEWWDGDGGLDGVCLVQLDCLFHRRFTGNDE